MSNTTRRGVLPLPGVASSYRSDVEHADSWRITSTSDPAASTSDAVSRTMSVSDIDDEISRVYRARELVRARVTVNTEEQVEFLNDLEGLDPILVHAVDAYRVNVITKQLGYNTDLFSEVVDYKKLGNRYAALGDVKAWNSLLSEGIPLLGTKSFNQLVTGVRQVNPEWATQLREVSNSAKYGDLGLESWSTEALGETNLTEMNLRTGKGLERDEFPMMPRGYRYVLNRARGFGRFLQYEPDPADIKFVPGMAQPDDKEMEFETSDEHGNYAPLVLDRSVPLTKMVKGYLHRKKKSSNFGKRVLYPSRMLTDPTRQIFGSKVKANGGVVVIDVSGSMSLSIEDVNSILEAAPGAVVLAYSHRPDSKDPNCTVLAFRGKQVQEIPKKIFRGGNGVDGPALAYAVKLRKSGEPLVWICDGQVTSASDGQTRELVAQTSDFVVKHKIIQIPTTHEAVEAFKNKKLVSRYDGAVGDYIRSKYIRH